MSITLAEEMGRGRDGRQVTVGVAGYYLMGTAV